MMYIMINHQIKKNFLFMINKQQISDLKLKLNDNEINDINEKIDKKILMIIELKEKIDILLKTDFKNITKVYDTIQSIYENEKDLKKLKNKLETENQYTGNYNHSNINYGWGTITSTATNSTLIGGSGLWQPIGIQTDIDNVNIEIYNTVYESYSYQVLDDVFKSELNNYYLISATDNSIFYLNRIYNIDEKLNNNSDKDSKLKIWFDNKNRSHDRKEKMKKII